jgi:WD40 repeat protein
MAICPFADNAAGAVNAACFSFDGRHVLTAGLKSLELWEVEAGRRVRRFCQPSDEPLLNEDNEETLPVCLSSDGHYVLSGAPDKKLRLWDVTSGSCLRVLVGHTQDVTSVSLSADGRYALSGSKDRTLKLWFLDWELQERQLSDWSEGGRPYLETFLTLSTPHVAQLPLHRDATNDEVSLALTRRGKPTWTDAEFQQLLYTLGCAGFGWLRPEGVRREL